MVSQVLEDRSKVDQLSDFWGRNGASLPFYSNEVKGERLSASIRTRRGMWVHIFIFFRKIHYEFYRILPLDMFPMSLVFTLQREVFVFIYLLKFHRED